MGRQYLQQLFTPEVLAAQAHSYGRAASRPTAGPADALGDFEREFLAERDSFYLATVTSEGWPYVQHRGGVKGFLKVLNAHTVGFADLKGNRQLISTGNFAGEGRVSLISVDYPHRERLKIMGRAKVLDARQNLELTAQLSTPEDRKLVERLVVIDVVGFDWNCPAHITPRYTIAEVEALAQPLRRRIEDLERQLALG